MSFQFIQNPTGQGLSDQDYIAAALDQPMSMASTFFDQAKGGVLESFGLGTAIRESQLPAEAPTRPDIVITPPEGTGPVRVPDTPQMRRRMTAFQSVNPDLSLQARPESQPEFQQRQQEAGALSEDAYKASPFFRKNIPWQNGMTSDRAAALADQDDRKKVREFYASKRPITAFFGNLGGQAIDPINYIPVATEAVAAANIARFGRVAGKALTSAIDAAGNTAAAALVSAPARAELGDDVSFQSTISQIAMAAVIGGAFGAVAGKFGRETPAELRTEAETKLATLQNVQEARVALNDALDGMIHQGEANVSPAAAGVVSRVADTELPKVGTSRTAPEELRSMRAKIETDYQFTPEAIMDPNPYGIFREEMKTLPDGVNEQFQAHGMMASSDGSIAEKRLIDLIDKGLDKDRSINSGNPRGGNSGVDSTRTEAPYILLSEPGKTLPETGIKNVVVQGPAEANMMTLRREYPTINFMNPAEARQFMETGVKPDVRANQMPAASTLSKPAPAVLDLAVPEAAKRVGKPEVSREVAEQFRVNPETGEFPEMADVDQLIAEGRVTDEDMAILHEADATIKSANAYGEAVKAFAGCAI